eukprot:TRINITY_DN58314_c0_g1_i1.p1 TRINITY_DN58314_c0_g1~~TRINITY_DN58314_c0_g1_i1.p1  ORF type:complete len:193 (-),score=31.42 TRINITY_DN58314_c0_g1_i1:124-630(-)
MASLLSQVRSRFAPRLVARCAGTPWYLEARWSSSEGVTPSDLRKGMIYFHEDRYKEVTEWHLSKTGRGSATYQVTHTQLDTGISKMDRFGGTGKVTRIEPDKRHVEVTYLDKDGPETMVMMVDEEYNEVAVPLSKFVFGKDKVVEGANVTMYMHDDDIIKIVVVSVGR